MRGYSGGIAWSYAGWFWDKFKPHEIVKVSPYGKRKTLFFTFYFLDFSDPSNSKADTAATFKMARRLYPPWEMLCDFYLSCFVKRV